MTDIKCINPAHDHTMIPNWLLVIFLVETCVLALCWYQIYSIWLSKYLSLTGY